MKAKVIKTGEIVDVYHEPQHGQITNIYKESVLVNGRMWTEDELNFCVKANVPEKLYISDYGSEVRYNWHPERLAVKDIEYIRTDAFIEKACKYLEPEVMIMLSGDKIDTDKFIEDFRKYMEGE